MENNNNDVPLEWPMPSSGRADDDDDTVLVIHTFVQLLSSEILIYEPVMYEFLNFSAVCRYIYNIPKILNTIGKYI